MILFGRLMMRCMRHAIAPLTLRMKRQSENALFSLENRTCCKAVEVGNSASVPCAKAPKLCIDLRTHHRGA